MRHNLCTSCVAAAAECTSCCFLVTVAQLYIQSPVWALTAIAAMHADRTSRVQRRTLGVVVKWAPQQAVYAVLHVPPCWSGHVLSIQRFRLHSPHVYECMVSACSKLHVAEGVCAERTDCSVYQSDVTALGW